MLSTRTRPDRVATTEPGSRTAGGGKRWLGGTATLGLIGMLLLGTAPPAAAHAELKSMTPAHKSVQETFPVEVTLTFNQPVNDELTKVRVTGPTGAQAAAAPPAILEAVVRQSLRPLTAAGRYAVAYRTVSVDGHVIDGTREFTFQPAEQSSQEAGAGSAAPQASAPPSSSPAASPAAASEASDQRTDSGLTWAHLAVGALLIALPLAVVLLLRRQRAD